VGKAAAEGYLRVFSQRTPFVSLRMFNVYGPGQDLQNLRQGMVSIYLAQALATKRIVVKGSAERYRDFVYIDDVVEAWVRALQRPEPLNTAINVGSGVRTEVGQLLIMIQHLVPGTTVEFTDGTPGDQFGIYADTQRMHMHLGLSPLILLQDGLRKFIEKAQLI
jgi:UDP-glucose 4-epimerase